MAINLEQRPASISYHESLVNRLGRPFFKDAPTVYEPNHSFIEASNRGETVSEREVFEDYFRRLGHFDGEYMDQIRRIVVERSVQFPEASSNIGNLRVKFIVPAYREGENIPQFLQTLKGQFEQSPSDDWGVTFVMDHAIPYKNKYETTAEQQMQVAIKQFIHENPQYRSRIDSIFYTRRLDMNHQVLPVGLARKIGEDVTMFDRLQALRKGKAIIGPLYLGLMDIDTGSLSQGLLGRIASVVPKTETDNPVVVRVRGSYNVGDVSNNLHLHPLQMMWEGSISQIAEHTKYNPFNVGRLSAVGARELAMTGGGFARKLEFTDEDVRKGIQIKWQLDGVKTVEVKGNYSTSARREIKTVDSIMQLLSDNGGRLDLQTLQVAALIKMYSNWTNNTFRKALGNVDDGAGGGVFIDDPLRNSEIFNQAVPPKYIEAMTNAWYRFTLFVMYAVDELSVSPDAPEVMQLKADFLEGNIAHFDVQLKTLDFIKHVSINDPARFNRLKPLLARVDAKARQSMHTILKDNGVTYTFEDPGPIYGILEEEALATPFKIHEDQNGYMSKIRAEVE